MTWNEMDLDLARVQEALTDATRHAMDARRAVGRLRCDQLQEVMTELQDALHRADSLCYDVAGALEDGES